MFRAVTTPDSTVLAWEPLTPRGVAAFAQASLKRLWLAQSVMALLAAAAIVWFFYDGWFPTVRDAIGQLPAEGAIRAGKLDWRDASPRLLAEGRFLAFSVDPGSQGDIRSPAHVQIEFERDRLIVYSLLGYSEFHYPPGWVIAFNRTELEPWWGAWQPEILAIAAAVVVVGLLLIWSGLATAYLLPVWLMGLFANRELSLRGGWRLAGAALMPGALLMSGAIVAYDFGWLDLVSFLFVTGAHLLLGWIYLVVSLLFLPRHPAVTKPGRNPFAPPLSEVQKPDVRGQRPEIGDQK